MSARARVKCWDERTDESIDRMNGCWCWLVPWHRQGEDFDSRAALRNVRKGKERKGKEGVCHKRRAREQEYEESQGGIGS